MRDNNEEGPEAQNDVDDVVGQLVPRINPLHIKIVEVWALKAAESAWAITVRDLWEGIWHHGRWAHIVLWNGWRREKGERKKKRDRRLERYSRRKEREGKRKGKGKRKQGKKKSSLPYGTSSAWKHWVVGAEVQLGVSSGNTGKNLEHSDSKVSHTSLQGMMGTEETTTRTKNEWEMK